ncbi:SDR family oxidoreductase [Flavobacterium enshiense]|uniref:SDR family oxidoreductase n=1 Tax=Flavobacterium enshiense TaxID=1341165 RepID=UPI00345DEFF6
MILITGATGGLGQATIKALLKLTPSNQIAALARDKSKASNLIEKGIDVRIGDYDSYESLVTAFKGIDKLLLISAPALSDLRLSRESNAIKAAKEAGVKHILFTGIQNRKDQNYIMPMVTEISLEIEKQLKESGLHYTILENSIYADSVEVFIGSKAIENGVIFPAGNGKIAYASRADLGEGIANLLVQEGHENKKYTLSNSSSWSFSDIAEILSEISGKEVKYNNTSRKDFIDYRMNTDGLPEFVATFLADWGAATENGEFEENDPMLEELLGRKPMTLNEFLKTTF